jgi:hypothetical protein
MNIKITEKGWYIQLYGKEYTRPSEEEFQEIEYILKDRGYNAELVRGDEHSFHGSIESHIKFDNHAEAMMYYLSFGGRIERYEPTCFIGGG